MDDKHFKRYEYKYLLTDAQRNALEQRLSPYMRPGPFPESTVCSLYYDTPDHRIIRHSLEGGVYKEKLRLRSYGQVGAEDRVYLELKKKYRGIVYKRRIPLRLAEAEAYLDGLAPLPEDGQIEREIEAFRRFYGELRPAVCLCYDRTAYSGTAQSALRVTFDRNIRWRSREMRLSCPPEGEQLLPPGQQLLEIKTDCAVPLWLVRALGELGIRRSSFSKYGTVYRGWKKYQQKNV